MFNDLMSEVVVCFVDIGVNSWPSQFKLTFHNWFIFFLFYVALGLWCFTPLSTAFQLYRGLQFYSGGGGNQSTWRKPPTCRKSLTNLMTQWYIDHTSPQAGFKLTTLVKISTDYCTGSCKSNYHTITTTTAPLVLYNIY
jgi:hypothetical protein